MDAMKELIEAAEAVLRLTYKPGHGYPSGEYHELQAVITAAKAQQSKTVRVWVGNYPGVIGSYEVFEYEPDISDNVPFGLTLTLGMADALGIPAAVGPGECHQYEIRTRKVEE